MKMVTVKNGVIKFKSLKAAYEAAKKRNPELKYITFYMRQRAIEKRNGLGWKVGSAMQRPPRKYQRKAQIEAQVQM
jgi:hypothetical protein